MEPVVFRQLPGIDAIERQLRLLIQNRLMKDEREALESAISAESLDLFGIIERETHYWALPVEFRPGTEQEWESHFEFLEWEFEEERSFWDAFGIDVSDEDGNQLTCIQVFGRQLVCALKRIHPSATLSFQTPINSPEQLQAAAEAWGRRLLLKNRS